MSELLDIARAYVRAGLSVIPIERGGKLPYNPRLDPMAQLPWIASDERSPWRVYTRRFPTDRELVAWFADSDAGIGIVGGQVSGGLVMIDFECQACLPAWLRDLEHLDSALARAAANLPIAKTGKGHHVYLRMPNPPGHEILSSQGTGSNLLVLSETQGEGCYCVAPPSQGYRSDYTPFQYEWVVGDILATPTLDRDTAVRLLDAARFRGFWAPEFVADWGTYAASLHRSGLAVRDTRDVAGPHDYWFGWEHLKDLHAYLDRYGALLVAVETAPPPPPSYDDSREDDGDDETWEDE